MIDGLSLYLPFIKSSLWLNHGLLRGLFVESKELLSGKRTDVLKAEYKGLQFIITLSGQCYLKGSIHKFYNKGLNNNNRFTYKMLDKAIKRLRVFGINPPETIIKAFEFGLNLFVQYSNYKPFDIYNSFIYSKGVERSKISDRGKNRGFCFDGSDRNLKIYEKIEDYKPLNVCRIEERFKKMRSVEKLGIKTLSDLLKPEILTSLFNDRLLLRVEQSVIYEYEALKTTHKLPKKYKSVFKDLRNPVIWANGFKNTQIRKQKKQLFENIINKYSKRNIKSDLIELLVNEFRDCMDISHETKNAVKSITNAPLDKGCEFSGIEKEEIGIINKNYCQTCGKDISHQKKGSKFCNDQRKCRDAAYNFKKAKRTKKENSGQLKEISKFITDLGNEFNLTRIVNPNNKRVEGKPQRKTSIKITYSGKEQIYNGGNARFFLNEFEKIIDNELTTQTRILEHGVQ